jgi:hypothetical protein
LLSVFFGFSFFHSVPVTRRANRMSGSTGDFSLFG